MMRWKSSARQHGGADPAHLRAPAAALAAAGLTLVDVVSEVAYTTDIVALGRSRMCAIAATGRRMPRRRPHRGRVPRLFPEAMVELVAPPNSGLTESPCHAAHLAASVTATLSRLRRSAPRRGQPAPSPTRRRRRSKTLAGDHRSAANRARDVYRHPKETLTFFGLRQDMTVHGGLAGRRRLVHRGARAGAARPRPLHRRQLGSEDRQQVHAGQHQGLCRQAGIATRHVRQGDRHGAAVSGRD